jgi:hypothetical protein
VSEQTAMNRAEANANHASEGEQPSARVSERLDAQATDADLAEAQGGGTRMVPHQALHAERQKVRRRSSNGYGAALCARDAIQPCNFALSSK